MSSCGVYIVIKWIKSIELNPRVLKVECKRRGQTILLDRDDNVTLDRQCHPGTSKSSANLIFTRAES